MNRLTSQDFRDILDIIHIANSQLEPIIMQEAVLHSVVKSFRAERGNFFLSDGTPGGIDVTGAVTFDIDKSALEQYDRYYYRYDPFNKPVHSKKVVCKRDEVCPEPLWVNLEYYNDFLKHQKIHHQLTIYLRSSARLVGSIALFRSKKHLDFSERDAVKGRMLAPHLTMAINNSILFSEMEQERNPHKRLSEPPSLGTLLLDYELCPIYYNFKAKHICHSLTQKSSDLASKAEGDEFYIAPEILQDCLALKELFQGEEQSALPYRLRTIELEEGRRFRVKTCLAQRLSRGECSPYFSVLIEDLCETPKKGREIYLMRKYHLTEREIEVIQCASRGLTSKEIAQELCISWFTVRNHLESIFEKTGLRNRTELTHWIELS